MAKQRQRRPRGKKSKPHSRWKEFGKPAVLLAAVALGFGLFFLFVYDPLQPGPIQVGSVERVYQPEIRDDTKVRLLVRLESGSTVQVDASTSESIQNGQRVELQEHTTTVFRRKAYKFIRVVE